MYPLRVTDRAQSVLVCITWQPGHLRSGIEYECNDALQQHFLESLQPAGACILGAERPFCGSSQILD